MLPSANLRALSSQGEAPAGQIPLTRSGVPRVALVFPYFRTRAATELLFPPLGAATLAAQLRRLEIDTRVFDGTFGRSRSSART